MIIGFVTTCDICGEAGAVSLGASDYSINGDMLTVLDRWVCDKCIKNSERGEANVENIA